MGMGVAGQLSTKHIYGDDDLDMAINAWLNNNPGVSVIDIKFSASANNGDFGTDALIIYRKEG